MPFFIPVDYYDSASSSTTTCRSLQGPPLDQGRRRVQPRATRVQTFVGFANGRYIFSSTDGFLNYARNPRYVECSNGVDAPQTGACPAAATITGPLLLFLQQAGVGGLSVEEAGTQDIPQTEPAFFVQDKWQPTPQPDRAVRPALGERRTRPTRSRRRTRSSTRRSSARPSPTRGTQRFPSNGDDPVRLRRCGSRGSASPGTRAATARRSCALNGGIFYGRVPGPGAGLVALDERQPRPDALPHQRRSTASAARRPPIRTCIPPGADRRARSSGRVRLRQGLPEPAHRPPRRRVRARGRRRTSPFLLQYNYAKGEHITRFVNRNDPPARLARGARGLRPGRRRTASARSTDGRVDARRASTAA